MHVSTRTWKRARTNLFTCRALSWMGTAAPLRAPPSPLPATKSWENHRDLAKNLKSRSPPPASASAASVNLLNFSLSTFLRLLTRWMELDQRLHVNLVQASSTSKFWSKPAENIEEVKSRRREAENQEVVLIIGPADPYWCATDAAFWHFCSILFHLALYSIFTITFGHFHPTVN